jgi:hypothetical protein
MSFAADEACRRALRERIRGLVTSADPPADAVPVDVIVSHIEVCDEHGTGVLTKRLFGDSRGIVSVRSQDQFGGRQAFGDRALLLRHRAPTRRGAVLGVLPAFTGLDVRRIVCIPYFADDVVTAIGLKALFGAPLCTFIMDDNNIEGDGIPDELMRDLVSSSDLRLAISNELGEAYEEKFGVRFWLFPPVVGPEIVLHGRVGPTRGAAEGGRGVMVGNVWGAEWLERLRDTLRGTGIEIDWYCNSGLRWVRATEAELAADGIRVRGTAPEPDLVAALRAAPYVVVPSGTLDAADTRRAIARFSLPSRITYVLATSHAPIIVVGHPETAAARFVTSHGIGATVPYDRERFVAAVAQITGPDAQIAMRARAAELAPALSAEGATEWIWASLRAGRPVDDRFARLVPKRQGEC